MFLFADEAADDQCLAVAHAYVSIGGPAVDAVIFQFAYKGWRADLRMYRGSDIAVVTDNRSVR